MKFILPVYTRKEESVNNAVFSPVYSGKASAMMEAITSPAFETEIKAAVLEKVADDDYCNGCLHIKYCAYRPDEIEWCKIHHLKETGKKAASDVR